MLAKCEQKDGGRGFGVRGGEGENREWGVEGACVPIVECSVGAGSCEGAEREEEGRSCVVGVRKRG